MSASIYWKPKGVREGRIDCWAPSAFVESMNRAFGPQRPWILGPEHLATLRGMASVCDPAPEKRNPYEQLIAFIENNGEPRDIEVWPEY